MSRRAVILAAGRGRRMQASDTGVDLSPEQAAMADRGLKGLIPVAGRPFLAWSLEALARAGFREVCLVVGPGADPVREVAPTLAPPGLAIRLAVQAQPLGSADALAAAESFVDGEHVVVINSDNYYPPAVLAAVAALPGSGLAGFDPDRLVAASNIPAERLGAYALAIPDGRGGLADLIEKPTTRQAARWKGQALISMTCWSFRPLIFEACRRISPSRRGEYELTTAVRMAVRTWREPFTLLPVSGGVLDLSIRADIPQVARYLGAGHPS